MWGRTGKKKVLVINGSPKQNKSSTMVLTNAFIEGMKEAEDIDLEIINVQSLNIKPCTGCLSCWGRTEGECIIKTDDVPMVKEKILEADIIIESFPLFFFGMPGILKLLTDRLLSMMNTYRGHKPPENGESFHGLRYPDQNKRFIVISSCAYTEVDRVYDSVKAQFDYICGKDQYYSVFVPQVKTLVDVHNENKLNRFLKKFIEAGKGFMESGMMDSETLNGLAKPPFSEGAYKIFLDQFWQEEKK
ncbi:MAG: flavodoxin family protein [Acholeplasmatales bacterium]|nr:flavodoxin family protein [Acholeplasmatales bacterium]